ncbi:MAG: hypothetical protein OXI27_09900, partial [Thaumarchaeota archaeon]|nr:hypothetical protein [Nitrososphaerota archaeon]
EVVVEVEMAEMEVVVEVEMAEMEVVVEVEDTTYSTYMHCLSLEETPSSKWNAWHVPKNA